MLSGWLAGMGSFQRQKTSGEKREVGSREANPGELLPPPRMFWGCSILIPSHLKAASAQMCLVHPTHDCWALSRLCSEHFSGARGRIRQVLAPRRG